jgi:4-amino-4-deoxy-L-arabinose transferase-like glycosyltransferase
VLWLVAASLLLLVPFLGRAFNVDEPLFLWVGRQVGAHPANPFGFAVNWNGTAMPIAEVTKNPPLVGYLIALAARVLGWSELALHGAFLLPALAAVLGTYALAREWTSRPRAAALAALCTPVFAVTSTSVMADTTLLAFWVLAVWAWVRGLRKRSQVSLALAAVLVGAAALSKYVGLLLIPLLALDAWLTERRPSPSWLWLLLPLAIVGSYLVVMQRLYGRPLILDAASFAVGSRSAFGGWTPSRLLIGLTFTGGCMPLAALCAGRLWSGRTLVIAAAVALVLGFYLASQHSIWVWTFPVDRAGALLIAGQCALLAIGGLAPLSLAVRDALDVREPAAIVLVAWIAGVFAFATLVNWTINGRTLLLMVPAAAISLARALEPAPVTTGRVRVGQAAPWVAAAALAVAVAAADAGWADSARRAARDLSSTYRAREGHLWFMGHWGFQYYMEALGGRAVDFDRSELLSGDQVVFPQNNTAVVRPPPPWARWMRTAEYEGPRHLATMQPQVGAGFHADVWGPLPYAIGDVPRERYDIFEVAPVDSSGP